MRSPVINARRLAAVLVVAFVAALVLNVGGLLRYPGGPLREPSADGLFWLDTRPSDQGTSSVGAGSSAGLTAGELIYTGISLRNTWSYPAAIESISLVDATPGLRLVDVRLARPGTRGGFAGLLAGSGPAIDDLRLVTDYQPLPATLEGNNPINDGLVSLVVTADQPGDYSYQAVAINYRIGPFSFSVIHHQALAVCLGPFVPGTVCSVDLR